MIYTRRRVYLIITLAFFLHSTASLYAEHFFLKNGEIMEGEIIKQSDTAFTIKASAAKTSIDKTEKPAKGDIKNIPRKDVLRILYSSDYKNRVYIYHTDGAVTRGHIVEENQDSYIIRGELSSPVEVLIQKKDINFVARQQIKIKGDVVRSQLRVGVLEIDESPVSNIEGKGDKSLTAQFIEHLVSVDRYRVKPEPIPMSFIKKNNLELDGLHDSEDIGRICISYGLDAVIFVKIFRRDKNFSFSGENFLGDNGSVLASEYIKFSKESEIPEKLERLAYGLSGYSVFGQRVVLAEREVSGHRFGFKAGLLFNIANQALNDASWINKAFGFSISGLYSWRYVDAELNYTGRYFNGANESKLILITNGYPYSLIGLVFGYYFINTNQVDNSLIKYNVPTLYQAWNWHSLLFGLTFRLGNTFKLGVGIGFPMYLGVSGTFNRPYSTVVYQANYQVGLFTFNQSTITDKNGIYPNGPYIFSVDWMIAKNHGIALRLEMGTGTSMHQYDDQNNPNNKLSLYLGYTQLHLSYIFMF